MADLVSKTYCSYAKINLFLHILNKRNDGYHNLQTWFTFLDFKDHLAFVFNDSGNINITSNIDVSSIEDNLIYKAIKLFQECYSLQSVGVDVSLSKNIPMGAGLGGGSSNAATTLIAMRDQYLPDLSLEALLPLAARLGADVPIFIYGKSAWAEGVGDILYPKYFESQYALLIKPNIHISTKEFFESEKLVKTNNILDRCSEFDEDSMHNDFERIFFSKYPSFGSYLKGLEPKFRMTGTGSCFYILSENKGELEQLERKINKPLDKWLVKTLNYAY